MPLPSLKLRFGRLDPILVIILIIASCLLFYRLDHRPFWQDEAETACLARNTLVYGVPRAFDGVNLISQEGRGEFDDTYLWRWSPWLQIYVTAAAFLVGGPTTFAGRFPYALGGLASIFLVYVILRRLFDNLAWARLSAACLTFAVPFLLFCRQCRYYSLGACLALLSLWAFRQDWQHRGGPAVLLVTALGLMFYTNYVLFFSFLGGLLLSAMVFYRRELPPVRSFQVMLGIGLAILPGCGLFLVNKQAAMMNMVLLFTNFTKYITDLFEFISPLPVVLGLIGILVARWRRTRPAGDAAERFLAFLVLLVTTTIVLLLPVPQCEFRYLVHLYPLAAIALGWVILQVWQYHRFSGMLLGLLLLGTNWLHVVPMEWVGMINRPLHNDDGMLTHANVPLKLFLTELTTGYPDVNQHLIDFFQTQARPEETILVTYGDLPLQFYTPHQVMGGLQGTTPPPPRVPDWVVKRWHSRWDRDYQLIKSEDYILRELRLEEDYQEIILPAEDEIFGNRADPYYHRFLPPARAIAPLTIFQRKSRMARHVQ